MVQIGCGQLTWQNVDPDTVLREIAQAGYDGAPGGLDVNRPAPDLVAWFATFGLAPAPPYFSARFWDRVDEEAILARAMPVARYVRELGLSEVYVAPEGFDHVTPGGKQRYQLAGHVSPDDALTSEQYRQFGRVLGQFAEATAAEGVTSCFHNHVGSVIETAAELDTLLDHVTGDALALGLDTGHIAWAGDDATEVCLRHLDRIRTLHLKDVNGAVRARGAEAGWEYGQFTEAGVFAEPGEGIVDFPSILEPLRDRGFNGWLIVETDVTMKPTALESATISRNFLRSIGW